MLQSKDFSITGVSTSGITYTFILRVTELSADVVKNTSELQVQAILTQSFSGTGFSNWGTGVSCSLNGTEIFSDYVQRRISGTKEHVFYTWEGELPHNDDGTLQLQVEGRLWQNASASYTPPELIVQGDMALSVIARASTVNASSGNIEETVMVAVAKKNDRFTHTLSYRFGMLSGFVDADGNATQEPVQLSASACAFRLPESFYSQIPDDPSAVCELVCTTYDGAMQIGTPQGCSFTATAEKNRSAPLVTGQVKDVNTATVALTGDENVLVRYASTAGCFIQAQSRNGAALESVQIAGVETPEFMLEIPQAEGSSFSFRVVDSRNYETVATVEKPVVPYVKLTCNPQPVRTDPGTGVAKVVLTGNCYCGSFGVADNTLRVRCGLAGSDMTEQSVEVQEDHTYRVELELADLDYTQSYDLAVAVQDRIAEVTATVRIGQAIPVFDWGKDYFHFHVPVTAAAVNDRGICYDADAAISPGVYRLIGSEPVGEGLLLVFGSADALAQLAVGVSGRKTRMIQAEIAQPWIDW